jgi:hypothetical protein
LPLNDNDERTTVIAPKDVRYIKLGDGGRWANNAI